MMLGAGVAQGGWPHGAGLLAAMEWAEDEPELPAPAVPQDAERLAPLALAAPLATASAPRAADSPSSPSSLADLYMADPQIVALVAALGGEVPPATSTLAQAQLQAMGSERYGQLCRLSNALHAVRAQYTSALGQAAIQGQGPGWVDHVTLIYPPDEHRYYAEPIGSSVERRFEPDAFTAWYTQQDGVANRAFAELCGQSHTTTELDQWGLPVIREITFDNPSWNMGSVGGPMIHSALTAIDLNQPPELNDAGAVGFDLEVGWVTAAGNVHRDAEWLDSAAQLAMVGAVAWLSAGTLGPAAAGAFGLSTATAAGAAVAAAAVGAATSVAGGLTSGNLSAQGVLRGALSGALTAGLSQALAPGLSGLGDAGTVVLRGTVQGAVQALMGGSFRDGAAAGLASGLAEVAVGHVEAGIAQAVSSGAMRPDEVFQARIAARVMGSAIRALAGPDEAGRALAQGVLQDLLGDALGQLQAEQGLARAGGQSGVQGEPQAQGMQGLELSRAQEERLQTGATVTDFGDATGVAGEVTAAAGSVLRLDAEPTSLSVRRSGRTVYLGAEPPPDPMPRPVQQPAPQPESAAARNLREQGALDQVLQTAAQAQAVGLAGATGDPSEIATSAADSSPALSTPNDGSGTIRALGGAEAFFTFNPAGQLLKGVGHGAVDLILSPAAVGKEVVLASADALGTAAVGARNLLTGSQDQYALDSGLGRTLASEGLLGTAGLGMTGLVQGLLAPVNALYRQDLEALGQSLPGALLAVTPLGVGTRVSAARGLTVEELAIVERGNAARFQIIDRVTEAAQPAMEAIRLLDPEAKVGFRGSIATGLKNSTKLGANMERLAFNDEIVHIWDNNSNAYVKFNGKQGYDIDMLVISDDLYSKFPARPNFRNLGKKYPEIASLMIQFNAELSSSPLLLGYKSDAVKVRVWSVDGMNRKILGGDSPYIFNPVK